MTNDKWRMNDEARMTKAPGVALGSSEEAAGLGRERRPAGFGFRASSFIRHLLVMAGADRATAPPPTNNVNRPSDRWRSASLEGGIRQGRGGEHHFVCEERAPFAGLGVVVLRAADE